MRTDMTHHGAKYFHRGMHAPYSKYHDSGKFGRIFPSLAKHQTSEDALNELGKANGIMDPGEAANTDHPSLPAGFVFLGQFIDHDITFDTTSSLEEQNDPEGIQNFRTPVLELDSLYGSGPAASPYLYDDGVRLLIDQVAPRDLPRNSRNMALIGDPRNDENLLISQLHLSFIKFHNAIVDDLDGPITGSALFKEAQRLTRWHFQWIVLHEFLPRMVGQDLVDEIYTGNCMGSGRIFYKWRKEPFIPVEFSVAAYRFGHTLIPGKLKVNDDFKTNGQHLIPLFDPHEINDSDPDDLSGGARSPRRYVEWKYLFDTEEGVHQPAKQFNSVLSGPLFQLPFGNIPSLAQRNLLRGRSFGLPSGQQVAAAMCIEPLTESEIESALKADDYKVLEKHNYHKRTPLWYYILLEAQIRGNGITLGPVGGRIVAEVLIGLLEGDRKSFLRADPGWKPEIGENDGEFTMKDMFKFANLL